MATGVYIIVKQMNLLHRILLSRPKVPQNEAYEIHLINFNLNAMYNYNIIT